VNTDGTLNALEFAKRHGIPRAVVASSSATFGETRIISFKDSLPGKYSNLYSITKIIMDRHIGGDYSARKDVECISLRYFNTYCPAENSKGIYSCWISKIPFLRALW